MFVNNKSNNKKILLVAHRFYKDSKGGTETLVEDIAAELIQKGFSVFIMAVSNDISEKNIKITYRDDGICCISIPCFPQKNIVDKWEELEKVQTQRINMAIKNLSVSFDIVHIFHFARIGLEFFTLPIFKKSKLFITLTDYSIFCPDYQMFNRKQKCICTNPKDTINCSKCINNVDPQIIDDWRIRNIEFINNNAQLIYTQTHTQQQLIVNSGIKEELLSSTMAAYKIPTDWEKLVNHKQPKYTFGFFGRISPEKGLDIFLKAYLESNLKDQTFLICGSFDDDQHYNTLIKELIKQSQNIFYSPPVSIKELGELISSVNYAIFPSIWNENHSILLTYACALGISVFCSAVPSLTELTYPQLNFVKDYDEVSTWKAIIKHVQASKFHSNTKNYSNNHIKKDFHLFINTLENNYLSA